MAIYYLEVDDVERINHKLVSKSEASYNYKGGIDFILSNMKRLYEELPEREAVIAKTAYLWHSIASNQYFSNGNKRTGYVVADVFLQINNMRLNAIEDEKFFVSYAIANRVYEIDHVRYWITKSLK